MGVKDFFKKMRFGHQLNIQDGRFELLGLRGLILPAFIYMWLFEELYKIQGDDSFEILFNIGKKHAEKASEEVFSKYNVSKKQLPRKMLDALNLMGLGRIDIKKYNYDKSELILTVKGSVFAEYFSQSETLCDIQRPVDEYLRGLIYGYMDIVFTEDITATEQQCEYLGAAHCIITVRPRDQD